MESTDQNFAISAPENIDQYIKKGDLALKRGEEDESIKWYMQGLSQARALCNLEKESYISSLIGMLI